MAVQSHKSVHWSVRTTRRFPSKAHDNEEKSKKKKLPEVFPTEFSPNYSPGWTESSSICNGLFAISTNVVSPGGPINFNRSSTENQGRRPNIITVKISE